jgi:serine/threonine protein kinase
MESLKSEVYILKSCDHENIIKCFGFYEKDDELFIITEIANGG